MAPTEKLQLHRPVVGPLARREDCLLVLAAERPRARPRPRGARAQTRPRRPVLHAGGLPAMPPAVRGRRRDAQAGRGLPERRPLLDQPHELKTAQQSELAPTVLHVRPPSAGQSSLTAPSVGGRTPSQAFTNSVGRSPRPGRAPPTRACPVSRDRRRGAGGTVRAARRQRRRRVPPGGPPPARRPG